MKTSLLLLTLFGAACLLPVSGKNVTDSPPSAPVNGQQPRVEVCFVLDTTGSMGGLIEGAKQKIWSIANEMVKAKPQPELKIGLVAFRDRGDDYVTKPFALTDDIDTVYANLMKFQADGGGDTPESVNEALAVAVHKMAWSADPHVLKMIFLVGDAPPHMDYSDDVKYPVTCQEAVKMGIIVNTVQCGAADDTKQEWTKIASLSEGRYVATGETGNVAVIATPMDKDLAQLNIDVGKTLVPYGKVQEQQEVMAKQARAESSFSTPAAAPAAADRLAYNVTTGKAVQGNNEMVTDYQNNPEMLKDVKSDDLPANLKGKTSGEITAYLKQQQATRAELQKKISDLNQQREKYIAEEQKKQAGPKDSFDQQVSRILHEEAAKKGMSYE